MQSDPDAVFFFHDTIKNKTQLQIFMYLFIKQNDHIDSISFASNQFINSTK